MKMFKKLLSIAVLAIVFFCVACTSNVDSSSPTDTTPNDQPPGEQLPVDIPFFSYFENIYKNLDSDNYYYTTISVDNYTITGDAFININVSNFNHSKARLLSDDVLFQFDDGVLYVSIDEYVFSFSEDDWANQINQDDKDESQSDTLSDFFDGLKSFNKLIETLNKIFGTMTDIYENATLNKLDNGYEQFDFLVSEYGVFAKCTFDENTDLTNLEITLEIFSEEVTINLLKYSNKLRIRQLTNNDKSLSKCFTFKEVEEVAGIMMESYDALISPNEYYVSISITDYDITGKLFMFLNLNDFKQSILSILTEGIQVEYVGERLFLSVEGYVFELSEFDNPISSVEERLENSLESIELDSANVFDLLKRIAPILSTISINRVSSDVEITFEVQEIGMSIAVVYNEKNGFVGIRITSLNTSENMSLELSRVSNSSITCLSDTEKYSAKVITTSDIEFLIDSITNVYNTLSKQNDYYASIRIDNMLVNCEMFMSLDFSNFNLSNLGIYTDEISKGLIIDYFDSRLFVSAAGFNFEYAIGEDSLSTIPNTQNIPDFSNLAFDNSVALLKSIAPIIFGLTITGDTNRTIQFAIADYGIVITCIIDENMQLLSIVMNLLLDEMDISIELVKSNVELNIPRLSNENREKAFIVTGADVTSIFDSVLPVDEFGNNSLLKEFVIQGEINLKFTISATVLGIPATNTLQVPITYATGVWLDENGKLALNARFTTKRLYAMKIDVLFDGIAIIPNDSETYVTLEDGIIYMTKHTGGNIITRIVSYEYFLDNSVYEIMWALNIDPSLAASVDLKVKLPNYSNGTEALFDPTFDITFGGLIKSITPSVYKNELGLYNKIDFAVELSDIPVREYNFLGIKIGSIKITKVNGNVNLTLVNAGNHNYDAINFVSYSGFEYVNGLYSSIEYDFNLATELAYLRNGDETFIELKLNYSVVSGDIERIAVGKFKKRYKVLFVTIQEYHVIFKITSGTKETFNLQISFGIKENKTFGYVSIVANTIRYVTEYSVTDSRYYDYDVPEVPEDMYPISDSTNIII